MYGYRRRDIGLLRLFLPTQLHVVFKAINNMEKSLRELVARNPDEEFRGIYVESGLSATRRNVLAPGAVGIYSAGSSYNPAQVVRDSSSESTTKRIDKKLTGVKDKTYLEFTIDEIKDLILMTTPEAGASEHVWNSTAVAESVLQFAKLHKHTSGYVYVDRDRGLKEARRETQGILTGQEGDLVPADNVTLFMLRTKPEGGGHPAWWPQVRFPRGNYGFAFSV